MKFIKTTVIGGALFMIPVVVLVVVIGKAVGLMVTVAEPLATFIPIETVGDIALVNILAIVALILLCFIAGLIAQTKPAGKMAGSIESAVLERIPGYTMFRGMTGGVSDQKAAELDPVMVSHMGIQRIGLQVEQVGDDRAAVYFPNAPNVWSGVVEIVPNSNIEPIDASMMNVIENIEKMGRGSHDVLTGKRAT